MTRLCIAVALLIHALTGASALADELRPAYLNIREMEPGEFAVLWKVPAAGDLRLGLYVRLPETCKPRSEPVKGFEADAFFERWTIACPQGLNGREIGIDGLDTSMTDVLARIEYRGGQTQVARLNSSKPRFVVTGGQTALEVAKTYFLLGVEHILTSLDHLLFVLALILLISGYWTLAKTITAFTVAHSITLAGAALGLISLPQKPVEATIALSIAFLARELVMARPGETRLSETYPWAVAFAFGLLHGFGFAGALNEIGLPQQDLPLALLTFNLGVEAGQLLFVVAVVAGINATSALFAVPSALARRLSAYLIGTASTLWLCTRIAAF
jgi:hydrogenase/urease accessory protein HupE